jgi:hypothetical protein
VVSDLLDKVLALSSAFDQAEIPYSFGGALALGYYTVPRMTRDIDINIYLTIDHADRALELLAELGADRPSKTQLGRLQEIGQVEKLYWEQTPLDLFFSNLDFHDSCEQRKRQERLQGESIDILSAEDLMICKVVFGRPKDFVDIDGMLETLADELDVAYLDRWTRDLLGVDHANYSELSELLAKHSRSSG